MNADIASYNAEEMKIATMPRLYKRRKKMATSLLVIKV